MQDAAERFTTFLRDYPGVDSWLTQLSVPNVASSSIPSMGQTAIKEHPLLLTSIVTQTDVYLVAADPYFEKSRRMEVLGLGPASRQVLPVQTTVINRGDKAIWVQREGIVELLQGSAQDQAPVPSYSFKYTGIKCQQLFSYLFDDVSPELYLSRKYEIFFYYFGHTAK